jgi:hypothetical protein
VPHSILATYTAHLAAIALQNAADQAAGGESAEWPDIAAGLADVLETCLAELPVERPIRNVFPTPVVRLNGDWPILVIVHQASTPRDIDSVWTEWTHRAELLLLCGPWPGETGRMQALGTPYIWAIKATLDGNRSLDGRVRNVTVGPEGAQWKLLPYGTPPSVRDYFGLSLPVAAYGYNRRVYQV